MRLPTVVVRGGVLASWLTVADYTRSRLATELGVSKGRVSQILNSHEEPSAHLIAKLLTLTRLPFDRLFQVVQEPLSPLETSTGSHKKEVLETTSSLGSPGQTGQGVLVQHRRHHA